MGALTEQEIFDCMRENCAKAAAHCEDLAKRQRRGPVYNLLREELKLIEGCCRQACQWREDARWLNVAKDVAKAHVLAGEWLRGVKVGKGPRRAIPEGERHPLFMKLAEILRNLAKQAEKLKNQRTGRSGMILPLIRDNFRETRQHRVKLPDGMAMTPGGLIIPHGVSLH
jgi:hypothetical protein